MILEAVVLAATQINPPDSQGGLQFDTVTPFLNLGLIGVLFLMFIARKGIVPEWVLKQEEDRHVKEMEAKDADIAEMKRLLAESTQVYNDQVVPALTRSVDVNRQYVELLRQQAQEPIVYEPAPAPPAAAVRRRRATTPKTSR